MADGVRMGITISLSLFNAAAPTSGRFGGNQQSFVPVIRFLSLLVRSSISVRLLLSQAIACSWLGNSREDS